MTSILKTDEIQSQTGGAVVKMQTLKHPSSSGNNITLASDASVNIDGLNVKDNAIVTDANKYTALKTGELNSKGYVKNNVFCVNYYPSNNNEIANSTWTELGGSNAGMDMGWTVLDSTGTTGSTNSDPFGKFDATRGRFTPTISGYYYISVWFGFSEDLSDGKILQATINRNGQSGTMNSNLVAYFRTMIRGANNEYWGMSGSVNLDTDDYVSCHVWHNQGDGRRLNSGKFVAFYLGENL